MTKNTKPTNPLLSPEQIAQLKTALINLFLVVIAIVVVALITGAAILALTRQRETDETV